MRITQKRMQKVDALEDVLCDICHKSCMRGTNNYEFATLSADWGYFSDRDGENWECHICNECASRTEQAIKNLGGNITKTNSLENLYRGDWRW